MIRYSLPLIAIFLFVAACTTHPKTQTKSEVKNVSGEFLFYDNAAVLNTGSEIYGVVVDDKLHELHAQALTVQKDVKTLSLGIFYMDVFQNKCNYFDCLSY